MGQSREIPAEVWQNAAENLASIAEADPLIPGMLNQAGIRRRLEMVQAKGKPYAAVVIDLDNFKSVNDKNGHGIGNEVLRLVWTLLQKNFQREGDMYAGRLGDEYILCISLENLGKERADTLEEAQLHLEEHFEGLSDQFVAEAMGIAKKTDERLLGLSWGLAVFDPQNPKSVSELLEEADANMYSNKARRERERSRYPILKMGVQALAGVLNRVARHL